MGKFPERLGEGAATLDILPNLTQDLEHPSRFHPLQQSFEDLKNGQSGTEQNQEFLVERKETATVLASAEVAAPPGN